MRLITRTLAPGQPHMLADLVAVRAAETPDRLAFTFLLDGETESTAWTYAELDARARAIAALLQQRHAAGARALLMFPAGLDFVAAFIGCLYAGIVAVPLHTANPAQNGRRRSRVDAVVRDADPSIVLTVAEMEGPLQKLFEAGGAGETLHWIAVDTVPGEAAEAWRRPELTERTIAFLQYTSGSTAAPKGVMVSHGNLLHNEAAIQAQCNHTEASTFVGWLPLFHDMGLIGNVLQPLYIGAHSVLMPPTAFLEKPGRWLRAIHRYRGATSGGPNFGYELCVRKIGPEERAALDLSSWTVAFNGAEPVRPGTLARFVAAFERCGFRAEAFLPCYGLAEATLMVTGNRPEVRPVVRHLDARALEHRRVTAAPEQDPTTRAVAGSGTIVRDQQVHIVDPDTRLGCPADGVGEIWVKGPSVALGYWNRDDDSTRTFDGTRADTGESGFLRTGDLGFMVGDELFVVGRLKDVIIIRGRNHFAEDVEDSIAGCHPAIRPGCAAAFAVDAGDEERLVVAVEIDRRATVDAASVTDAVRERIGMVHQLDTYRVVLLRTGGLPKTSSGKLRRGACKAAFLDGTLDVMTPEAAAPDDREIRERVLAACASALRIPAGELSADAPLIRLGLDSLSATELAFALKTASGVQVNVATLLGGGTAADVAAEVLSTLRTGISPPSTDAPREDVTAASWGQRALWLRHQLAPESAAYNVARALTLRPRIDVAALRLAIDDLAERHAALRTGLEQRDGEIVQRIHPRAAMAIDEIDATGQAEEAIPELLASRARQPFALDRTPLLRMAVVHRSAAEDILLIVAHHAIADLWSLTIFLDDLMALYTRHSGRAADVREAAPSTTTYAEYARGQQAWVTSADGQRAAAYWKNALAGATFSGLWADRAPASGPADEGDTYRFRIDAALTARLRTLARAEGATLFSVLMTAFAALLRQYSGRDDLLIGSPTLGRPVRELARVIGYFVNPVVLRARVSEREPIASMLRQVHETVLGALEHQVYPYALLPALVDAPRTDQRSPLFDVMFAFQTAGPRRSDLTEALALGAGGATAAIGPFEATSREVRMRTAQFDLSLFVAEGDHELGGAIEYRTGVFDEQTIVQFVEHLRAGLDRMAADPRATVAETIELPASQRALLTHTWQGGATAFEGPIGIHQLIEAQVRRTPAHTAVVDEHESLSYDVLNSRANQLARRLSRLGAGPETTVGVCLERSASMVVTLLAILKAGAAYVPLDPAWPAARLRWAAEDARVRVIVSERAAASRLPDGTASIFWLDHERTTGDKGGDELSERNLDVPIHDESLAYIIYTSGSTGRPKGVMNGHGAVRNRLLWMQQEYGLTPADRVLQKTPFSFDVSVWEFFWPLLAGATLVMARPGGHRDPAYLRRTIGEAAITTIHFVPSMLAAFLEVLPRGSASSLRRVIVSGEALTASLHARFVSTLSCELHNLYGPTEAAVDVTSWPCGREPMADPVPIGRPITNATLHVLDASGELAPPGVAGELCIGSVPVARGYVGAPDLTASVFVPDPNAAIPGRRLYRTGDRARWRPDGVLVYLGRSDQQIKIRGQRVELGEIESVLRGHDNVREAVVVVLDNGRPELERLAAYIVPRDAARADIAAWRAFAASKLPDYMTPATFVVLDELPLSAHGKIDRRALPSVDADQRSEPVLAPRNELEQTLSAIWSDVLGVAVGVSDNFFELGGHSLLATRILTRASTALQLELPVTLMFEGEPTIAGLANRIQAYRNGGTPASVPVAASASVTESTTVISSAPVVESAPRLDDADTVHPAASDEHWRANDVRSVACGDGLDLIWTSGGAARLAPSAESVVLAACETFRPAEAIVRDYRARAAEPIDDAYAERIVEELIADGFLISPGQAVQRVLAAPSRWKPSRIDAIAMLTCDRPALLRRGLESYVGNAVRHGRSPEILILDDSRSPRAAEACAETIAAIHAQWGTGPLYAGARERAEFATALIDAGIPPGVARFALLGEQWGLTTVGSVQNTALLEYAGHAFLGVDDDTVCGIGAAPDQETGIAFASSDYANEVYPLASPPEAFNGFAAVDTDLLALHEAALGTGSAAGLIARTGGDPVLHDTSPAFLRRLAQRDLAVVATFNGYRGDSGWNSPSAYLHLEGASFERLVRSESGYRAYTQSRSSIQVVNRLTVSDRAGWIMTAFCGLDHRELLPPFPPIGRGQDAIFGVVLAHCLAGACVGHLPWTLLHMPAPGRVFRAGEVLKSAGVMDLATVLRVCIDADRQAAPADPAAALRHLGAHLEALGTLPPPEFGEFVTAAVRARGGELLERLSAARLRHAGAAPYWAEDVRRYTDRMRKFLLSDRCWIPHELQANESSADPALRTQAIVRRYGELLRWWPDVVAAANALRRNGRRAAVSPARVSDRPLAT